MIAQIRRCLAAHQIPSRYEDAAAGPRLDVWRVAVPAPAMERALRLGVAMEAALDAPGVTLRQRGRLLQVEIPRPRGDLVSMEDIGPALGVTPSGRRVNIRLDRTRPHAIVAGRTGSGKSVLAQGIGLLESREADTRLVLIDLKRSHVWDQLGTLGHLVATDQAAALASLTWAAARIGAGLPGRVVVIIDEVAELEPAGRRLVLHIAERGREDQVHLVMATQYVRADVLDKRITTSAYWRLCGSVFGAGASRLVLDQAGAEQLVGEGDFLLSECGAPALRFQAALPGPGAWRHARGAEPLELAPAAAGEPSERVAWAAERIAERGRVSAAEISERFSVGTTTARAIRDEAKAYLPTQEAPLLAFPVGRVGVSR